MSGDVIIRLFAIALLCLLALAGCASPAFITPTYVHEDAHSSGGLVAIDAERPLGVSGGLEGTLVLWDLDSGRRLVGWSGHRGTVNGLALSARQGILISAGWDGRLVTWDLQGRLLREVDSGEPISTMAAAPDLSLVWTGHADGTLRRWNRELELQESIHLPGAGKLEAMSFHHGRLAVADGKGNLWLLQGGGASRPVLLARLPTYLRTLAFGPDGRELFGGTWFHLYRWNLETGEQVRLETAHRGIIASLAWSPAAGELMSISRQTDSSVLSLDPVTGATRRNFGRHELCGASVAVSRDGRYLISTSDDASVRIWHLEEESGETKKASRRRP